VVGEGIQLGTGAKISRSVIGRNVRIGSKVKLENSVVMDDAVIEDNSIIGGSILCHGVHVPTKCRVLGSMFAQGYVLEPGSVLKDNKLNRN
jgi:NDP-sugar pyrophosphorylase family protein